MPKISFLRGVQGITYKVFLLKKGVVTQFVVSCRDLFTSIMTSHYHLFNDYRINHSSNTMSPLYFLAGSDDQKPEILLVLCLFFVKNYADFFSFSRIRTGKKCQSRNQVDLKKIKTFLQLIFQKLKRMNRTKYDMNYLF